MWLVLLIVSWSVEAEDVNVAEGAALVATQDLRAPGALQAALEALVSKNTGLSVDYLRNNGMVSQDFSSVVLRHYFEQSMDRASTEPYWLHVVADESKLSDLLALHELPIWPKRRTPLYVWMVSENANGLLQHEPNGTLPQYWLSQWLSEKGVPAMFHQVAEDDLLDFAPDDVKNLNPDLIDYVHQVLQQPNVLLVYLRDTGRGYSYRMGLAKMGNDVVMKNRQFVDLSKGFAYLSDFVQSHQAASQQIQANELANRTVAARINNINNADNMLAVLNYLDAQTLVKEWQVLSFKNNRMELNLSLSVIPETFTRFVSQEQVLQHLPLGDINRLIFSFQGQ